MKVVLLRDHLDHKAGDKVEADEARVNYWVRIGLVADEKEKREIKHTKEKKEIEKPAAKHKK